MIHKQACPGTACNKQVQSKGLVVNTHPPSRTRWMLGIGAGVVAKGMSQSPSPLQAYFWHLGSWRASEGDTACGAQHSSGAPLHILGCRTQANPGRESPSGAQNQNSEKYEANQNPYRELKLWNLVTSSEAMWEQGVTELRRSESASEDKEPNVGHRKCGPATAPKPSGQSQAPNFWVSPHTATPREAPGELKYLLLGSFLLEPRRALGQWAHPREGNRVGVRDSTSNKEALRSKHLFREFPTVVPVKPSSLPHRPHNTEIKPFIFRAPLLERREQ